jgi:addiction module HigA family antidote
MKTLPNIHPGEVLLEEFLLPMGISQNALARATAVPPRRINEIVLGKRAVKANTAVRLAAALGTSARFWMGLQSDYDLEQAQLKLGSRGTNCASRCLRQRASKGECERASAANDAIAGARLPHPTRPELWPLRHVRDGTLAHDQPAGWFILQALQRGAGQLDRQYGARAPSPLLLCRPNGPSRPDARCTEVV